MRPRVFLTGLLWVVLAGAATAGWAWGWREHRRAEGADFVQRRLSVLETDHARLAKLLSDRRLADVVAADQARRREIEGTVAKLRGLKFLRPVTYKEIPRAELPAILRQKLAQQVPDQEFGDTSVSLAALGLLPVGLDLKKTYLDLLGEQIGAFYDQHSAELFTFSGQPLDNGQNRVILAHELTHALEDQHFQLARLPLETKGNDDRALAASALVEGDATLVMSRYMLGDLSASSMKDALAGSFSTDVRQLAAAPRYLRETLLFPYLRGEEFCQVLYQHGGWEALAAAFRHPPESTAEILHPERFLAHLDKAPTTVQLAGGPLLGQAPIGDNVLGEFGVRQLLARWLKQDDAGVEQVASGWRADRYLVYGNARDSSYLWKSVWASPESAASFAAAVERCWCARFHLPADAFANDKLSSRFVTLPTGHSLLVERQNETVTLLEAQDRRWQTALEGLIGTNPAQNSAHDDHLP